MFIGFTIFSYRAFQSHIFTLHFVDEDENIIAGYYMGKGEKFYKDIFSHKQPLPAVVSMFEQKIQKPNSLYLLIKRHREIVYFYSLIWTIVLIIVFGLPGLFFGIIFEITKQLQLGNMFLSESLVIFPLTFTLGFLWKRFIDSKTTFYEDLFFSFGLSLIVFLQFTLLPYVFFVILILYSFKKINKRLILLFSFCFTMIFFICSLFVDYRFYLDNTYNALTSIYLGGDAANNPLHILSYSFLRPFTAILEMKKSEFGIFTGIVSLGYLLSLIYLFIFQKRLRKILILTFFLLGCCSLRIVYPDKTIYSGFHGLPWLGAFLFITAYQIILVLGQVIPLRERSNFRQDKIANYLCLFTVFVFLIIFLNNFLFLIKDYFRRSDRETDWYVNYSRFYDYGQVVRILSEKEDKLMVLPAEQLIYWQSGLSHASRFLYGYLFVSQKYKQELYAYWDKTPPAFIYDEQNMNLFRKWWPDYIRVKKEKEDTPLFIRKDKLKSLKQWQTNEIKRLNFKLPAK